MSYDSYHNAWIKKRRSGQHLAHDFLEKPFMRRCLEAYTNYQSVLCLGCGDGSECKYFVDKKYSKIVGLDPSKGLIENARYQFPEVEFQVCSLEEANFTEKSFDLVYSSLTMHYIQDWVSNLKKIGTWLKPGGKMLFSTHHPIKWGSQTIRSGDKNSFLLGYVKKKKPMEVENLEIYGDYLNFRPIQDTLFGKLNVTYFHRSISQMFSEIQKAGLQITGLWEPIPSKSTEKTHPDFYKTYTTIPLFLVLEVGISGALFT